MSDGQKTESTIQRQAREAVARMRQRDEGMAATIARLRRLYLHVLAGGTVTANDLSRVIASLEELSN